MSEQKCTEFKALSLPLTRRDPPLQSLWNPHEPTSKQKFPTLEVVDLLVSFPQLRAQMRAIHEAYRSGQECVDGSNVQNSFESQTQNQDNRLGTKKALSILHLTRKQHLDGFHELSKIVNNTTW